MSDDSLKHGTTSQPDSPAAGWVHGFSPLPTGTKVGELTILSVLGAGEFGITYVTEHAGRGKRYVLKEYFPRSLAYRDGPTVRALAASMPDFTWGLDRFLAEARALQKVRHPAIVAIHGVTEVGGTGYVGMNYEQGRDFAIWLHELKRPPTQDEIDRILLPLLQGLEAVHAAGLIHQDIAPDSILVREDGSPVLVDFGSCRAGMRRRGGAKAVASHPYTAPEQFGSGADEIGAWTDIYALSAVLYHAVSGQPPAPAHARLHTDTVRPVAAVTEGRYRTDFLSAIDAGLMLSPGSRPASLADWRQDLTRTHTARIAAKAEPSPALAQQRDTDATRLSPFDEELPAEPERTETLMENQGFRALFFGITGLFAGGIGGALLSMVVASLVSPECATDNCIGPLLPALSAVGAAIGIYAGVRAARQPVGKARGDGFGGGY